MMIGPAPMIMIEEMSVLLGMVDLVRGGQGAARRAARKLLRL